MLPVNLMMMAVAAEASPILSVGPTTVAVLLAMAALGTVLIAGTVAELRAVTRSRRVVGTEVRPVHQMRLPRPTPALGREAA